MHTWKLIGVATASTTAAALADVAVVGASRDNTLYETSFGDASNGAGPNVFAGHTNVGLKRRALMKFDIAGSIPAGSTIASVSLKLHMSMTIAGDTEVSLHRVNVDWGEGASFVEAHGGRGTDPEPGDATWNHRFYPDQNWAAAGGQPDVEYVSTASAATTVGAAVGDYTWVSTSELVADAQAWLDTPGANFGWMIIGLEDGFGTTKRFDSRENVNPDFRPVLTVAFTPPCYANCDGSSGNPVLTANDFQCFLNQFAAGDTYANCDQSTGTPNLTANDFQCFLNKFAGGC